MDQFAVRFSRFFIKHRGVNLAIIGGLTLFFAWHALQLQVFSQFVDLLPRNHSFVQVYEKYNRQFGSANVVTAAIVAKNGTIYDEQFLEKVYAFTDQIDKVEGVDHGQISSITAITIRDQEVDREGILRSRQIIGEQAIALLEAQFFTRRTLRLRRQSEDRPGSGHVRGAPRARGQAEGRARRAARVDPGDAPRADDGSRRSGAPAPAAQGERPARVPDPAPRGAAPGVRAERRGARRAPTGI